MNKEISIISIEDEPVIAGRLERLSRLYFEDSDVKWQHQETLAEADEFLQTNSPDIILLDLNLYGEDGFELLKRSVTYAAQTIVISAYTERALEAFELGVLDFVPKPFSQERFLQALDRTQTQTTPEDQITPTRFLSFRNGPATQLLPLEDILFIRGADKYADVVTKTNDTKFHDKPLTSLSKILPDYFVRIHKSYIVPMTIVSSINSREGSRYDLTLNNGEILPVGRTRVHHVRQLYDLMHTP